MQLRRLLGFSGRLRRSLCTAATPPPDSSRWGWYTLGKMTAAVGSSPDPYVVFGSPPRVSDLYMPEHLTKARGVPEPDPEGDVVRLSGGQALSASQDGLLLLSSSDIRATATLLAKQGGNKVRQLTGLADPYRLPHMAHFVFNPVTGQLCRLPAIQGPKKILAGLRLGILTQTKADGGRGPPDRYAVAELDGNANVKLRFISGTGDWDLVSCSPCQLPADRRMVISQEVVPFSGYLWWVDVTWGVICADPFSDRPEPRFIELPSGSVLPADTYDQAIRRGSLLPDAEGNVWWKQAPDMYRRVGISRNWLRYVEVSEEEPFVLSSFTFNADGSGWTLEHRVELSPLLGDGDYPWLLVRGPGRRLAFFILVDLMSCTSLLATSSSSWTCTSRRLSGIVRVKATSAFCHVFFHRGFQHPRSLPQEYTRMPVVKFDEMLTTVAPCPSPPTPPDLSDGQDGAVWCLPTMMLCGSLRLWFGFLQLVR